MQNWIPIVGKAFDPDGFGEYVNSLAFTDWKPSFIVLHNTGEPTLAQWQSGPENERINNLVHYYRDQLHWHAGPHLFVSPTNIWVFTPLTVSGVHSPSWNSKSWGIEMVGDYDHEALNQHVWDNTVSALATLSAFGNLDPASLRLHKEDPATTHRNCPGKNISKENVISAVQQQLSGE